MTPKEVEFKDILRKLGRSDNTIKAYVRDLSLLFKKHDEINNKTIQDMIFTMSDNGIKPSTVRRFISSVKTYCSIFEIEINFAKISKPKLVQRESSYITDTVFTNGIGTILAEHNTTQQDREFKSLVFNFLYKTGMRVSELLNLTLDNYNTETHFIQIIGKGNKERKIPIHDTLVYAFDLAWFFSRLGSVHYNTVLYWTKKYFGKEYSPHSFRHGFTTKLVKKGTSERAVQSVLGHASFVTTLRYFHLNEDEIRKEVISALEEEND